MYPSVPPPVSVQVLRPVDFKLKTGWRYDEAAKEFVGPAREKFVPALPKGARIVFKVPDLARSRRRNLSDGEKELQRYMQVILPAAVKAEKFAPKVAEWPCADDSRAAPNVSLPSPPAR